MFLLLIFKSTFCDYELPDYEEISSMIQNLNILWQYVIDNQNKCTFFTLNLETNKNVHFKQTI